MRIIRRTISKVKDSAQVKALITAAGMGKRFGALTKNQNKALMKIHGKPLIVHIVEKLEKAGIKDIIVVTGFESSRLKKVLPGHVRTILNPFYAVSGILGSFWAARHQIAGHPFLFTTSDHYFHPGVLADCLKKNAAEVKLVVQRKTRYTKEDAKVIIHGSQISQIGKDLAVEKADGEYGGMAYLGVRGSKIFFEELEIELERGCISGYMMKVLKSACDRHGVPIRYSICGENTRIEVDSVHDLIQARKLADKLLKEDSDEKAPSAALRAALPCAAYE